MAQRPARQEPGGKRDLRQAGGGPAGGRHFLILADATGNCME